MKFFLPLLLFLSLTVSCSKNKNDDPRPDSYEYFSTQLTADMKYDAIVQLFGTPDGDIGSGIHIYVYTLSDATAVWIGYSDHIHYARHMDANGQLLHTII